MQFTVKTGDPIQIRKVGTEDWIEALLDLNSNNGLSLAVSADEALVPLGSGLAINVQTMRHQLLLYKAEPQQPWYIEIYTNAYWEVKSVT